VAELGAALRDAELVVTVVPSHVCREVYTQLAPHAQPQMIFANAALLLRENDGLTRAKIEMRKSELPVKICTVCARPFAWRRKWRKVWDEVRDCSDACRRRKKSVKPQTYLAAGWAM
jgi:hypothetical protein